MHQFFGNGTGLKRNQLQKYSITNIKLYWRHVTGVLQVPYEKLKYLYEAHFVSKDLHAKYALGKEGKQRVVFTLHSWIFV